MSDEQGLQFVGDPGSWVPGWPSADHNTADRADYEAKLASGRYIAGPLVGPQRQAEQMSASPAETAATQPESPKNAPAPGEQAAEATSAATEAGSDVALASEAAAPEPAAETGGIAAPGFDPQGEPGAHDLDRGA